MKYKDKNGYYMSIAKKHGKYIVTFADSLESVPFFGMIVNENRKEEFKNLVNLHNMKDVKEVARRIAEETKSVNKVIAENAVNSGNELELVKEYVSKLKTHREQILEQLSPETVAMLQKTSIYLRRVKYKGEVLEPMSRGDLFMKLAERITQ